MPDQRRRADPSAATASAEVRDEPLGADRVGVGDVAAAVPRRVVGVDRAERGQPRQLPRPGAAAPHQAVHQDDRVAPPAAVRQQCRVLMSAILRASRGAEVRRGNLTRMPVVKINAIEVPPDAGPELEKRFAHRAHAVDNQPGFLGFQLLRPVKGENRYFVVTQWESDEAFQAWASGPAVEAHAGQRANPVATGASLLEFEVVLDVAGSERRRRSGRAPACGCRRSCGIELHRSSLVTALACGCGARRRTPAADAAAVRRPHRHQHPAGRPGQADHGHAQLRLADRPDRGRHARRARQGRRRQRRPWTDCGGTDRSPVTGVDIGAGAGHVARPSRPTASRQDIELRTDDNRFGRPLRGHRCRPPQIKTWADIDSGADEVRGARYSYQASEGHRRQVHHVRRHQHRRVAAAGVDLQDCTCCLPLPTRSRRARLHWDDQLTITAEAKAVGSAGFDKLPPGSHVSVRTAAQQMISAQRQHGDRPADRPARHLAPSNGHWSTAGHHDPASMTPFPTMHELFSIGWGKPDLREQWQTGVAAGPRRTARADEFPSLRTGSGAHPHTGLAVRRRVVRHAPTTSAACTPRCRRPRSGRAAPVKDILSAVPGIDLDRAKWPYIGAKAGNLPGDLTFSWYAVDRTGQPWVRQLPD